MTNSTLIHLGSVFMPNTNQSLFPCSSNLKLQTNLCITNSGVTFVVLCKHESVNKSLERFFSVFISENIGPQESQKKQVGKKRRICWQRLSVSQTFLAVMKYSLKQSGVTYKNLNISNSLSLFNRHSGQ